MLFQPFSQNQESFLRFLTIKQMEATYYIPYRIGTRCQYVFQSIVSAASKQETISI